MKLYEIADEVEACIHEHTDPDTGEISDAGLEALTHLELERDQVALAVARFAQGEKVEGDAVKTQAERLRDRARAHHNRAERLKQYLAGNLPAGHKIRDDVVQIGWRRSTAVVIEDEEKIPIRLGVTKWEPSKTLIKDAIEGGEDVPGARIEVRNHLTIR